MDRYTYKELQEEIQKAWDDNDYAKLQDIFDKHNLEEPAIVLPITEKPREHFFDLGAGTFGGGFIQRLLDLYRKADDNNRVKIRRTWPHYYIQYVCMGRHKDQIQEG